MLEGNAMPVEDQAVNRSEGPHALRAEAGDRSGEQAAEMARHSILLTEQRPVSLVGWSLTIATGAAIWATALYFLV
jgi:hypothetical protein